MSTPSFFNHSEWSNSMAKQTKAQLQKEVNDFKGQIDQLSKRRGDLQAESDQLSRSVKTQAEAIEESLLQGLDTANASEALARDRAKLEALDGALSKADHRLGELNRQHEDKQKGIVRMDFDQVADEAYSLFLSCMDDLSAAVESLDALEAKITELNRVGAPAGLSAENDDYLRLLRQASMFLRGNFTAADGINYKIRQVEQNYPSMLAVARGRVNR
jgi:chromosome segregation ATPase